MNSEITNLCPDFYEWPNRWQGVPEDTEYGEKIIAIFESFVQSLLSERLNRKTIETHIDNLWLLGGELIRLIYQDQDKRDSEPLELIMEKIDHGGGPYCRHLFTENEIRSFDSIYGKLYKYLKIG